MVSSFYLICVCETLQPYSAFQIVLSSVPPLVSETMKLCLSFTSIWGSFPRDKTEVNVELSSTFPSLRDDNWASHDPALYSYFICFFQFYIPWQDGKFHIVLCLPWLEVDTPLKTLPLLSSLCLIMEFIPFISFLWNVPCFLWFHINH